MKNRIHLDISEDALKRLENLKKSPSSSDQIKEILLKEEYIEFLNSDVAMIWVGIDNKQELNPAAQRMKYADSFLQDIRKLINDSEEAKGNQKITDRAHQVVISSLVKDLEEARERLGEVDPVTLDRSDFWRKFLGTFESVSFLLFSVNLKKAWDLLRFIFRR